MTLIKTFQLAVPKTYLLMPQLENRNYGETLTLSKIAGSSCIVIEVS